MIGTLPSAPIVEGMEIARGIFRRMKSFLTYRIAATLQLLVFFFIALFAFVPTDYLPTPDPTIVPGWEQWPGYFILPVLLLMIITLLNDGGRDLLEFLAPEHTNQLSLERADHFKRTRESFSFDEGQQKSVQGRRTRQNILHMPNFRVRETRCMV